MRKYQTAPGYETLRGFLMKAIKKCGGLRLLLERSVSYNVKRAKK
jgi:hypothetical protein